MFLGDFLILVCVLPSIEKDSCSSQALLDSAQMSCNITLSKWNKWNVFEDWTVGNQPYP